MIQTINEIEAHLTMDARAVINTIWHYYVEKNKWAPAIRIALQLGANKVHPALKALNGCIVSEENGGESIYYRLTLLGVLLSDQGQDLKNMLEGYLRIIKSKLELGLEPREIKIDNEEVELALSLSQEQSKTLHKLILISQFHGGGHSSGNKWSVGVPYYLEDILLEIDLYTYIEKQALKNYDPNLPTSYFEKTKYLSQPKLFEEKVRKVTNLIKTHPGDIQETVASQIELIASFYNLVLKQARQSFRWAVIAAGIGLVFLLASLLFILLREPQYASIISLISGSVIEGIAGLNFYLYGKTSSQLAEFHTRLDITQRFLLANNLCDNLEGELKQQARYELIQKIYALDQVKILPPSSNKEISRAV
jgi:hypothetical protein